jgi:hypothetical protein
MSAENLIEFLRVVAARRDLLATLESHDKDQVMAAAADFGLPFTEAEFDRVIWDLEIRLAERRGETFDARFPLWETMWGQTYLAYLVLDFIPCVTEADVAAVAPPTADGGA